MEHLFKKVIQRCIGLCFYIPHFLSQLDHHWSNQQDHGPQLPGLTLYSEGNVGSKDDKGDEGGEGGQDGLQNQGRWGQVSLGARQRWLGSGQGCWSGDGG